MQLEMLYFYVIDLAKEYGDKQALEKSLVVHLEVCCALLSKDRLWFLQARRMC